MARAPADRGMGPANPKGAEKNFARLVKVAAKLPGVEGSKAHGWRDIRVNNKTLGGVRPDAQFLLVCADHTAKEFLLETQAKTFWQAPHYVGTVWVIVRPEKISDADLLSMLEATWRTKVTKKVAAEYSAKASAKPPSAKTPKPAAKKPAAKEAPAPRARKDHFARVVKIASKLPAIEVGTSYGTPGIRVRKKFLCRMKEDGETLVVIAASLDDKEFLMQMEPAIFYETPHYHGHAGVLVHLSKIDDKRLFNMLEAGWKRSASKKMLTDYEK